MVDWYAAVALLRRRDGRVLGVTRGRKLDDVNLPGGHREPGDISPLDTARRELLEETGLRVLVARPVAVWEKDGRNVVAFEVLRWSGELRSSPEGFPGWMRPESLMRLSCTYRKRNAQLLKGKK